MCYFISEAAESTIMDWFNVAENLSYLTGFSNLLYMLGVIDISTIGGSLPPYVSYGIKQYMIERGYVFNSNTIIQDNYESDFNAVKSFIQAGYPLFITYNNNYEIWGYSGATLNKGITNAHTMVIIGCKKVSNSSGTYLFYKVANSWGGYSYVRADKGWIANITAILPN
jgi:hypothetical protein